MTPEYLNWLKQLIASDEHKKFYWTKEWRRLRKKRLAYDRYECQVCKRQGKITKANTVHHIKHTTTHPELALTFSNLESICATCHNKEHPEKLNKSYKKFSNEERW